MTQRGRDAYCFDPPTWPRHCFSINRSHFAESDTDRWQGLCRGSAGCRQIVLTGGEKWILGPNDTRPRAEPLRQICKCWSIQSARKQEIRWRCLYRSRGYYSTVPGESFCMMKRCNLSIIRLPQLVFKTFISGKKSLSLLRSMQNYLCMVRFAEIITRTTIFDVTVFLNKTSAM